MSDLSLKVLGNCEISGKSQNFIDNCLVLSPPPEIKILFSISENLLKNRNWTFLAVHYFTWKLEFVSNIFIFCHWKRFLASKSPETPSNFIFLINFATWQGLWQDFDFSFNFSLKFLLLDDHFPDLFTEAQIWYWKSFKFGLGRFFRRIK